MEVLRIETDKSGTAIKPETRGSYETGKRGAWKKWHVRPHAYPKGGVNKVRSYTSIDTPGV